jgi:hypothetical protein
MLIYFLVCVSFVLCEVFYNDFIYLVLFYLFEGGMLL